MIVCHFPEANTDAAALAGNHIKIKSAENSMIEPTHTLRQTYMSLLPSISEQMGLSYTRFVILQRNFCLPGGHRFWAIIFNYHSPSDLNNLPFSCFGFWCARKGLFCSTMFGWWHWCIVYRLVCFPEAFQHTNTYILVHLVRFSNGQRAYENIANVIAFECWADFLHQ